MSSETIVRCLWHAPDGRCANCKAKRIRCDVLHVKDYEMCGGEAYYSECEFYAKRPETRSRS